MILQEEYIREILLEFELEKRSSQEYGNLYEYYSGERLDELAPLAAIARALPAVAKNASQLGGNAAKALSNSFKNGVLNLPKNATKPLNNAAKEATDLLKALKDKGISSNSEDDEKKDEAKKSMENIMSQFTQYMNDAAEPLKYSEDKNTEYHQALKDFGSKISDIDKMWSGDSSTGSKGSLSDFDFNDLEGIFSYTGGLPSDFKDTIGGRDPKRPEGTKQTVSDIMSGGNFNRGDFNIKDTLSDEIEGKGVEKIKGSIVKAIGSDKIKEKDIDSDALSSMLKGLLGSEGDGPGAKTKINPLARGAGGKK